jgi:hypothetical protein
LIIFVLAAIVSAPINIISSSLIAFGKKNEQVFIVLSWWISLMVLLFMSDKDILGIAISILCSYCIYVLLGFFFLRKSIYVK